jgi:hypothetical protein
MMGMGTCEVQAIPFHTWTAALPSRFFVLVRGCGAHAGAACVRRHSMHAWVTR